MRGTKVRGVSRHGRALTAAAVVLILAGCTTGDEEPVVEATEPLVEVTEPEVAVAETTAPVEAQAEQWADEVCASAVAWQSDVNEAVTQLPDELGTSTSIADATNSVADGLRDVADRSRQAAQDIAGAEAPDTENRDALRGELQTISSSIDDVGAAIEEALAVDQNPLEFVAEAQAAIETADESLTDVSNAWQRINELDLGEETELALRTNPDCVTLRTN